jgi:hypothetical protein
MGFFSSENVQKLEPEGYLISKIFKESDQRLSKKLENCSTWTKHPFPKIVFLNV